MKTQCGPACQSQAGPRPVHRAPRAGRSAPRQRAAPPGVVGGAGGGEAAARRRGLRGLPRGRPAAREARRRHAAALRRRGAARLAPREAGLHRLPRGPRGQGVPARDEAGARSAAAPATRPSSSSTSRACTARPPRAGRSSPPRARTATARTACCRATTRARPPTRSTSRALCGRCHHEGSPVQLTYHIPQDSILAELLRVHPRRGAVQEGPARRPPCAPRCHTAHHVLPHTDPRSSIARRNVVADLHAVPRAHRAGAPQGHQRRAVGEAAPTTIPACVDCHQPHKARRVFYTQGMADRDCLTCHGRRDLQGATGRALDVRGHGRAAGLAPRARSPARSATARRSPRTPGPAPRSRAKVDCSVCHAEVVDTYRKSTHGQAGREGQPRRPGLPRLPRHARHPGAPAVGLADLRAQRPDAVRQLPPRAARRPRCATTGRSAGMVETYVESIHGKGLLESGLTVTATCADCHTAHGELPRDRPGVERQPGERGRRPAPSATAASTSCSRPASTRPR